MSRNVETVPSGTSLREALRKMVDVNTGSLVVVDPGTRVLRLDTVKGIVPVFFALRRWLEVGETPASVEEAMFRELITVRENDSLITILTNITSNKTWRAIVLDDEDRVVGIVSATDIISQMRNTAAGQPPVRIGVDSTYYRLNLRWKHNSLKIIRQEEIVAEFNGVCEVLQEYGWLQQSAQDILLLRLRCHDGTLHCLFIDNDTIQTNVRLVSNALTRLSDVYPWLLPQDFLHRQGDVGIYVRNALPIGVHEISADSYPKAFAEVLSQRHSFDPAPRCRFYVGEELYYVRVMEQIRLVHPEHEALLLEPGLYQLIGAAGTPLPHFIGLRPGEATELKV